MCGIFGIVIDKEQPPGSILIEAARRAEPSADTSSLEGEIDQLVYQLYGLSEEEIKVVEGQSL